MFDYKKNVLIGILVLGVVAMSIAFAALSTRLSINGTVSVPDTSWNIYFDNWTLDTANTVNGHQNTASYPSVAQLTQSLSPNITKVEGINVTLNQPGDYVKYNFQIINGGSINASLDNFEKNLTCATGQDCSYISYNIECKDSLSGGNNVLEVGSSLPVNGVAYCSLTVTYNDQTNQNSGTAGESQIYTQSAVSATLDATWSYTQFKNYYSYILRSGTTYNVPSQNFYIRTNLTTNQNEVCGVFPNGTTCMVNNPSGYNLSSGYAIDKKNEMLSKGGTCYDYSQYIQCNGSGIYCSIYYSGTVICSSGLYRWCKINGDGSLDISKC